MDVNICQTCLSKDRRLIPLKKARPLIQEVHFIDVIQLKGGVCWECLKIMRKFMDFKSQVRLAQETLKFKIKFGKCLSRLSVHSKSSFDYYFFFDFDPLKCSEVNIDKDEDSDNINEFESENINSELIEEKPVIDSNCVNVYVDSIEIKPNVINNTFEPHDTNNDRMFVVAQKNSVTNKDNSPTISANRDKVQTNYKEKRKKKSVKAFKNQDEHSRKKQKEISNKFTKIVFTVEEMLKNREEKRVRPNFKKIPYKCDSCLIGFTTSERLDEHVLKKHNESIGPLLCDVCKVRFPHKISLERHCQKHFTLYKCKFCKFKSVELWQAYSHCKSRHSADYINNIHCQQCNVVVKTLEELDEHMRTQHVLYCNECGEKFKKKSTLRTHKIRIHGVKRDFVCNICNKSFMTASRLETHAANHNETLAQQLSYCSICKIQYKSVHVYRSHIRQSAAHSADQHSCPDCNKKFSSKVYLKKHYNFYHLKKSQFKCEICNKLFISDWRLKNHHQKHHGLSRPRNHVCNICGKKFFTQSTLRGHQLTHSEQRSFMCEDCGYTFKQRPALYTHTKLVHKGVKKKK